MKLIHVSTGIEIKVGSVIPGTDKYVSYCPPPHKPSSEGKMQIKGESTLHYCSCYGCEWIDRDDQ